MYRMRYILCNYNEFEVEEGIRFVYSYRECNWIF